MDHRTDTTTLGKIILGTGLAIAVLGGAVWFLGKTGIPFGNLPGDIRIDGEKSSFYFPIGTCIALSVIATIAANLIWRFFR